MDGVVKDDGIAFPCIINSPSEVGAPELISLYFDKAIVWPQCKNIKLQRYSFILDVNVQEQLLPFPA